MSGSLGKTYIKDLMIKRSLVSFIDLPEDIDKFIDDLIEGQKTTIVDPKVENDSLQAATELDIVSQNLPPVKLKKRDGKLKG